MLNLTLIDFFNRLQLQLLQGRKWLFTGKKQRELFLDFYLFGAFFGLTLWLEHSPPLLATHEIVASKNLNQHLTPVRLQLKWKHQFQFAGYYAAKAKGYYRDAGLDVSFLEVPDTIEPAQQVLQGKAEFGVSNSDLVLLRGRGNPVVALAAIYQHSPLILLALEKSGINNVHQLAGKRVMLEAHSQELVAYLMKEGIDPDQLIPVSYSFDPLKLLQGKADAMSAYSTDEPFFLQKAGIPYLEFNPRAGGIDFYGDTLFTTKAIIRDHPQQVKAFLDASLLGWQYAMKHPGEIIDLILKEYSQRHSHAHLTFEARESQQLIMPNVVEIGYMNPGRWRAIADIYADLGMLKDNINLTGFLYERNPPPPWNWIYGTLVGVTGIFLGLTWIAARFYRLGRSLRREIQERKEIEADLRAAEKRFRFLAENTPFPVLITELKTSRVLYINSRAAQKFEVAPHFMLEKTILPFYVNPEDRTGWKSQLEQKGYVENQEIQLKTATDSHFWASVSITLIEFEEKECAFVALMDVTEQRLLKQQLTKLANTDELTGLFNRRYFFVKGDEEYKRAQRYQLPLSFLMLDLDYFKLINDNYGHDMGDHVLKFFAELISPSLREFDLLGRLGGEEFAILLPNIDQLGAYNLAERLRVLVEESSFIFETQTITLTVSIGISSLNSPLQQLNDLLKQADQALYEAKGAGRNRVVVANSKLD